MGNPETEIQETIDTYYEKNSGLKEFLEEIKEIRKDQLFKILNRLRKYGK